MRVLHQVPFSYVSGVVSRLAENCAEHFQVGTGPEAIFPDSVLRGIDTRLQARPCRRADGLAGEAVVNVRAVPSHPVEIRRQAGRATVRACGVMTLLIGE